MGLKSQKKYETSCLKLNFKHDVWHKIITIQMHLLNTLLSEWNFQLKDWVICVTVSDGNIEAYYVVFAKFLTSFFLIEHLIYFIYLMSMDIDVT